VSAARSITTMLGSPGVQSAAKPLGNQSPQPTVGARKPVQRVLSTACADCGAPVIRARRARGPLPTRCPACAATRRSLVQLRAYLRAAARLANARGLGEVSAAIEAALAIFDAAETDR